MARKTGSHAEITGPRIKTAALELFARDGYAAVSMRQIAAKVGVQAGTIYQYTPDKQTLLFSLLDGHMNDLLAAWAEVKADVPAMRQLRNFCEFHLTYHLDRKDEVFISYMELRNLTPENFVIIEEKRRRYEAELEEILIQGKESGVFDLSDIRLTSMAIIAMLTGVNNWYSEGGRLSRLNVVRIHWRLVRRLLTGGRQA